MNTKSKNSYKVGDEIEVKIIKVDILKYQIDLEIIETFQCRGKFAPFHIFIIKINIRWYLNFQVHTLLPCRKTCQEKSSTRRRTFNVMITLQDTIKFSWVTNCYLKILHSKIFKITFSYIHFGASFSY